MPEMQARDATTTGPGTTGSGTTEPGDDAPAGAFVVSASDPTPDDAPGHAPGDAPDHAMALRTTVFDAATLHRSITRIAHEIVERNRGAVGLVIVGLHTRGVPLAHRIAAAIAGFEGVDVPVGALDVAFHRDDIGRRRIAPLGPTEVPDVTNGIVVLVDDVLSTGRTVRAALDAVMHLGRPQAVQLAVLVDRGHRELPIRADYVGKNLPTKLAEDVRVKLVELDDGDDRVELWAPEHEHDHETAR